MISLNVRTQSQPLTSTLEAGQALYVLGPNGTGKSTLLYEWKRANPTFHLIAGNREVVFSSSAVSISASQAKNEVGWAQGTLNNPSARHNRSHHNNETWLQRIVFALKAKSEYHSQQYVEADQAQDLEGKLRWYRTMPLKILNGAFLSASLPFEFSWSPDAELLVHKTGIDSPYGVDQMSDGERAALIIAAEVILAQDDTAILIDEPERHLHRSISSPLLSYLREIRPDLYWVIGTHDLDLPRNDPHAQALILYIYDGASWSAELVADVNSFDPALSEAIYGARPRVLFVEGDRTSLDFPIYSLFYEDVTIVPAGSCKQVEQAVAGLSTVADIHRMVARGLVDNDNRADTASLAAKGIRSLDLYAIESIYYHPDVIKAILPIAGTTLTFSEVIEAGVRAISEEDADRLADDSAYKAYRAEYYNSILTVDAFRAGEISSQSSIDIENLRTTKRSEFRRAISDADWLTIVKHFKLKSTKAPGRVAKALGYDSSGRYEIAVRKMMKENTQLRNSLRNIAPDPFV